MISLQMIYKDFSLYVDTIYRTLNTPKLIYKLCLLIELTQTECWILLSLLKSYRNLEDV